MADGLGLQEDISANRANLRRDMIDDYDPSLIAHRMGDLLTLVLSGAALNAAVHGFDPLRVGVTHFGGFGS